MKYLSKVFFLVVMVSLLACSDDDANDKAETRDVELEFLSLEFLSEETTISTLSVKNFQLLSLAEEENNSKKFYNFEYSFEILNNGAQPVELSDLVVQGALFTETSSYGAAGAKLADATIAPRKTHKISYSANSSQLPDGLAIDGLTFQIVVYKSNVPLVTLRYLIHIVE